VQAPAVVAMDLTDYENICPLCGKENDNGRKSGVEWIDCDKCNKWVHEKCAEKAEG